MIVFLTLLYIGALAILIKLKVIKLTLWWKLSPIAWTLLLLIVLFVPMQWGAPAGDVIVGQRTVEIIPNVSGQVIEVPVGPNQHVAKGDVLFRIDPRPFQYKLDALTAQLEEAEISLKLAKLELVRTRKLANQSAAAQREVDQWKARHDGSVAAIERIRAQIDDATYDLEQTTIIAPANGTVTNVEALRPGARVVELPIRQAMAFVDGDKRILLARIHQIHLRHVEAGQPAEVVFKVLPGRVFSATVEHILPGTMLGQTLMSELVEIPQSGWPAPFFVRVVLDEETVARRLPLGTVGTVAIYTGTSRPTYIIRRVMMRMEAWLNYINPY